MSGRADPFARLRWARSQVTGHKALKALLLAIATYADETGECFPALGTLAGATEQSVDSVRRQLGELVAGGFVIRFARHSDSGRRLTDGLILPFDDAARALGALRLAAAGSGAGPATPRAARPEQARLALDAEPDFERPVAAVAAVDKPGSATPVCEGDPSSSARVTLAAVRPLERPSERPKESTPTPQGDGGGDMSVEDQDLWERFEARYRWDVTDPPVRAKRVFLALPRGERVLAVEHAGRYVAECAARDRKLMHGANWLRAKGWEPFAALARASPAAGGAAAAASKVWIRRGSPEWAAWDAHERSRTGRGLPSTERPGGGVGWWRPTRWPPGHEAWRGQEGIAL